MQHMSKRAFRPAFDGLEGRQLLSTLPETSSFAPARATFEGKIHIARTGTDSAHRINVESSSHGVHFGNKVTRPETSDAAPALAARQAHAPAAPTAAQATPAVTTATGTVPAASATPAPATAAPAGAPTGGQETPASTGGQVTQASVNRAGAAKWALANWNGTYYFGDDCADFVSRALAYGGGDPEKIGTNPSDDHYWYFLQYRYGYYYSHSWSVAEDLAIHLWWRGSSFLRYWNNAVPGDVIFANWNGTNFSGISHVGLVTGMKNGAPLITQHSPSQKNIPLSYWLTHGGKNVHVWIASPAPG
jgi:Putative amidase domain